MRNLGLDRLGPSWLRDARHVALVGHPKCGKSTFAEMLQDEYGAHVADDGAILRQAIPILTGIPAELCYSQEGKATVVRVGDRDEIVRQGLGELGNWLEARYGEDIIAIRTMQIALQDRPDAPFYVYPSVRKSQGRAYRRAGGIVIQIDNPRAGPTGNAFDVWDESCVDLVVQNDGTVEDLCEQVRILPNLLGALS